MPWRLQPMESAYTPPSYPGHDYRGPGEIIAVRCAGELVGHLTRKDGDWESIGWLPRPGLSEEAGTVRYIVEDILRRFAREGRPMVDALAEILNKTQHDRPTTGPLDGFRHPLAERRSDTPEPVHEGRCGIPHRLPDGRICAPARAEAPDGTLGDALVHLSPADPGYAVWDAYLRQRDGDPATR